MEQPVTECLREENQLISQLLNKLSLQLRALPLTRDFSHTAEQLHKLCQELSGLLHQRLRVEEDVLYPILEDHLRGISGTLERLRQEHDTGEAAERIFLSSLAHLEQGGKNRQEVMQRGRQYIQWFRAYLLHENGRLLPMIARGLDVETQGQVLRAMQELAAESSAHISATDPTKAQA